MMTMSKTMIVRKIRILSPKYLTHWLFENCLEQFCKRTVINHGVFCKYYSHDSVKVTLPLRVHMAMDKVLVFVNGESVSSVLYQPSIP